jgi:type IV pilus assembly protein PilC
VGNWSYEGIDRNGKKVAGKVEAANEKELRRLLRTRGVRPKKIFSPSILEFDIGQWMVEKGFSSPFGVRELLHFTKQLSIMINAGVPIIQCLEILYKAETNLTLKKSIKEISSEVSEGSTISEAMSRQNGFGKLYCNLVKAGEAGGILDTILVKLGEHMEKQQKIKSQIKSAMMYPGVVSAVGALVIWGMMVFVVPQFLDMLKSSGQEPPFVTQLVVDISNLFREHTMTAIPILFIGFMILRGYIKTPSGKLVFDQFTMKLPIFGGIIIKGNLSSFTRTLATMLTSGVPLTDSLTICIETIDNKIIARDINAVKKKVIQGKNLSDPLTKIEYFPDMVSQMIRVGEETGNIDQTLLKVAEVFEGEVDNLVSNMTKLIEPVIIVVLGGIVALILVAMYLPIFMSAGGA